MLLQELFIVEELAMKYTPKEVAELLKERPNQAYYIEYLVNKVVLQSREQLKRLHSEIENEAVKWDKAAEFAKCCGDDDKVDWTTKTAIRLREMIKPDSN